MSQVLSCEEHTSRRSTHGRPSVELGKSHSLGCHAVEMGGVNLFLPITPHLSVTQIIRQNEHNVGQTFSQF